jgi:enamine deaminase RidA (YjgF/YER057c/UK114 family)
MNDGSIVNDNMKKSTIEIHQSKIESCVFTAEGGITECHAMLHVVATDASFEQQIAALHKACDDLPSVLGADVLPVFKRYFLSDAANQLPLLQEKEHLDAPYALSVVQQPPLDGSKVALWVYLKSGVAVKKSGCLTTEVHHNYRHIRTDSLRTRHPDVCGQTTALLNEYASGLEKEGCTLENDCLRTWFFVQNVDANYNGMVQARKDFFEQHGMNEQTHYITSTGIEGRHADTGTLVMFEAYAVKGLKDGQKKYLYAPSHLNPTSEYGVTFERGVSIEYGDRRHIYISGTASIDNKGAIVYPGNITGQTLRMLDNIEALLDEAGSGFDDVAQMIVYLRNISDYPTVNAIVEQRFAAIPRMIVLAPVCRPGWLVETECIAITRNKNLSFVDF